MLAYTVKDIARMAGVSTGTVSRVLNKAGNVDPDMIRRTQEVIDRIQYHPGPRGRKPLFEKERLNNSGNDRRVLVLSPGMSSDWASHELWVSYMDGIKRACNERGYTALSFMSDSFEEACRGLSGPGRIGCGALLKTGEHYPQAVKFLELQVPMAGFGYYNPEYPIPQVAHDNYGAGIELADSLMKAGHRRLAFVNLEPASPWFVDRSQGFASVLKRHGLFKPDLIIEPGVSKVEKLPSSPQKEVPDMRFALERLLSTPAPERPSAVAFANDWMALGFYKACSEAGLRIPGDFSVMGIDDSSHCKVVTPQLSSVAMPFQELSYFAANMLLDMVEGAGRHLKGRASVQYVPAKAQLRASTLELES